MSGRTYQKAPNLHEGQLLKVGSGLKLNSDPLLNLLYFPMRIKAEDNGVASRRLQKPLDGLKSSSLSCTIGSKQAKDLTPHDLEGDAIYGTYGAEMLDQILHLDDNFHCSNL